MRRYLAAAAAVALLAFAPASGASAAAKTVGAPAGIVNIRTNLGYQSAAAAGTGIVLTSDGVVLTNNHVIRGATKIRVTDIDNSRTYTADVLGYALGEDIAVIRLENASGLQAAPIGDSATMRVGDLITAFGNAGGKGGEPASASGKITGLGKSVTARDDLGITEQLRGLLQMDAQLEPGDSGGPLVNADGKVVGIDTAASQSYEFSVNRGFAVPINKARAVASQIVAGHRSNAIHIGATAFIGVSVRPADPYYYGTGKGLIVSVVVPGSPIAKAGLSAGDVLTKFDGREINSRTRLTALVATKSPGDKVQIRWIDSFGTAHDATVELATGPPQ
jgi:S1-C subfamily serine protease